MEHKPCPFGNARCLCQDCIKNANYPKCESGYCIECFECDDAGKAIHDVYLCTGHERRPTDGE